MSNMPPRTLDASTIGKWLVMYAENEGVVTHAATWGPVLSRTAMYIEFFVGLHA